MKISLDLTAKQERYLIQIGLATLAERGLNSTTNGDKRAHAWTPGQRRKFIASMRKKWTEKKRAATRVNGHALRSRTESTRADGKPLRYPRKQWTAARRRKFAAAMKRKGYKLDRLAE